MAPPVENDINCSTFELVEFKKRFSDPLRFTSLSKTGSFEEIDTDSLLIKEILDEEINEKIVNKDLKRNMPACIIYTSGTSGNPKGVVLSHGGILSNCEGAVELLETLTKKKDPVFLTWLPITFL